MGDTGLEQSRVSTAKDVVSDSGGSKSGNIGPGFGPPTLLVGPADTELSDVIAAWPRLPDRIRSAIRSLVAASVASVTLEPNEKRSEP